MPYPSSLAASLTQTSNPAPSAPVASANGAPDNAATGFLLIALALSVALILFGYKKYCAIQRSRLLIRQIAMLEAMWRLSSAKRKF